MIQEYFVPWCLLKACFVLLGSRPGHVKVSHLYSMKIKDHVYAKIVSTKHKNVNFSGNTNISD